MYAYHSSTHTDTHTHTRTQTHTHTVSMTRTHTNTHNARTPTHTRTRINMLTLSQRCAGSLTQSSRKWLVTRKVQDWGQHTKLPTLKHYFWHTLSRTATHIRVVPHTKLWQVARDTKGTGWEQHTRLHILKYFFFHMKKFFYTLPHTNTPICVVARKCIHKLVHLHSYTYL